MRYFFMLTLLYKKNKKIKNMIKNWKNKKVVLYVHMTASYVCAFLTKNKNKKKWFFICWFVFSCICGFAIIIIEFTIKIITGKVFFVWHDNLFNKSANNYIINEIKIIHDMFFFMIIFIWYFNNNCTTDHRFRLWKPANQALNLSIYQYIN